MEIEVIDDKSNPPITVSTIADIAKTPGIDPESLKQIVEIFHAEQDRCAQKEFDIHFSAMQAEFSAVKKTRAVKNKYGEIQYYYAAIEDIQKQFNPVIAKHGFSYSFSDSAVSGSPGWRRVILRVAGHGTYRESSFDMPPVQGTRLMSQQQCLGAQNTYARRYAFISAFGLTVEGEDNDARPSPTPEIEKLKARCMAAETLAGLEATYRAIRAETGNKKEINEQLIPVCIERKAQIEGAKDPVY